MRKTDFVYAKTEAQISCAVPAQMIIAFVFATQIVQPHYILYTKFKVSSTGNFEITSYLRLLRRVRLTTASPKYARTKVTLDFHLTYSKNGGNLGLESK